MQWTHGHVQEPSMRWFELCEMEHYPAKGSIRRQVNCVHKGWTNGPRVSKKKKKVLAWTVDKRQDESMFLCCLHQILILPSECHNRNKDSSDQATLFCQSYIVQFWLVCPCCSLSFLFLDNRSGTCCVMALLCKTEWILHLNIKGNATHNIAINMNHVKLYRE